MPHRTRVLPSPRSAQVAARPGGDDRDAIVAALRGAGDHPLVHSFPHGAVFVFDHDLRFLAAGGRGLAAVGQSREMLEGKTIFEALSPEAARQTEPLYRAVLAGESSEADLAFRGRVYVRALAPILDGAGTVVAGMGFTYDVTDARAAQQALRESEQLFRLGFDNAPIGMALVDLQGRFLQVNPALCRLTGYDQMDLQALTFQDITHADDLDADLRYIDQLLVGAIDRYQMHKRYIRSDGELVWVLLCVTLLFSADGEPLHFLSQIQDVTESRTQQLALAEAHAFQEAVLAASPDIIHVQEVGAPSASWTSRSVLGLLGYSQADLARLGTKVMDHIVPAADRAAFDAAAARVPHLADGESVGVRHRVLHADGGHRWLSRRLTPFRRNADGEVTDLLGISRDVTEAVELEERLKHAALHDELTGLPNRRLVRDRLEQALGQDGQDAGVVVLFCDLDGFKRINDARGHAVGDAVLVEAATRLVTATRAGDTLGRMGGDEFVALLRLRPGEDAIALAENVAERIQASLTTPMTLLGADHAVGVSIGIAVPDRGVSADELLRDADTAMYEAKTAGKNGHAVFRPVLRAAALERVTMERHVRRAVADNTIQVHYQPIVEPGTGTVVAVEALLRLVGPDGAYLDTYKAVTVAEQTGLISAVGDRVVRMACEQVAAWRRTPEHRNLQLSVNLSAKEIAAGGLHRRISEVLTKTGLPPSALTLEITETVLLDVDGANLVDLRRLNGEGVGIAIDDFGTGYASLRYLVSLPITCLKIDRLFTAGLPHDPVSRTLVRATVGMAEDLGLSCVVEGVESYEQADALGTKHGLLLQGYLFSKPRPASAGLPTVLTPLR